MSLETIYNEAIFDDAHTDEERARVYVSSGELVGLQGAQRPESRLMEALTTKPAPQRVQLVGPSGSGKTSLLLRVFADLAQRENMEAEHHVLIVRVGDKPAQLQNEEAVRRLVLETIAVNGDRFSNISDKVLQAPTATEVTRTGIQREHRATGSIKLFSYSASLKEAFEAEKFGQNPARARQDLGDILTLVSKSGYRPVIVLDDTEKFVSPGADGAVKEKPVSDLYHYGVRALGEHDVDLIVATHPKFEKVANVREVTERLNLQRIDVPELRADTDDPALKRILTRRLRRHDIELELSTVIDEAAIAALQVLYFDRDRDLRSVLKVAHAAADSALTRGAKVIGGRDVHQAVRDTRR